MASNRRQQHPALLSANRRAFGRSQDPNRQQRFNFNQANAQEESKQPAYDDSILTEMKKDQ